MTAETVSYLDWAATAPLCEEAANAMQPYLVGGLENLHRGGNANSLHSVGRRAFSDMEGARADLARCVGCRPDELFFTCGATESNCTAVLGIVDAVWEKRKGRGEASFVPHVVVSSIEHEAVLEPARLLRRKGVQVTYLKPEPCGIVTAECLRREIQQNTVLVSVMTANNEVGALQPVEALAEVAHGAGALFHTDAVQAFGKVPMNCHDMGIDAASFSAHKIGGPKGVGALYLRKGTPCKPLMVGGGQESGMRSGTQNVAGAVGFAAAANACARNAQVIEEEAQRLRTMRDELYRFLLGFEGVRASVPCDAGSLAYLPNVVNVTVDGLESETMVLRMDRDGVCVSGGSACSSGSLEPSHVLTQLGVDRDRALGALRVSLGRGTRQRDIEAFEQSFEKLMAWARG